jgi:hypothetical protein
MFSAIKSLWRGAPSRVLRSEVVDALDKLSRTPAQARTICATTFLDALATVHHDIGPPATLSNDQRLRLAKKFNAAGRQAFDNNVGVAYGLFLVSAYLEAPALSGKDAEVALQLVAQYHRQAQAIQFVAKGDEGPL